MTFPLDRKHEQRTVRAEFRADTEHEGRITARVLTYGTVDSYATTFAKGVFTKSMEARMPRIAWNHDWGDVIGVWQSFSEDDEGLTLVGQLDDFDAVPRAKQAWAQLRSGSIDQFSVGFWPEDARQTIVDGEDILEFTRGTLDEASLVMVGAVPGTKVLSLRSSRALLDSVALVEQVQDAIAAGDGTQDIIDRVEAALAEAEVDDETIDEINDIVDDAELPEWTAEDVADWATLADEGDEDAAEALTALAEQFQVDPDDWETWTEFVADVLVEAPEADDDLSAGDASGDASGADDASESAGETGEGTESDDGASAAEATAQEVQDAEVDAAFQIIADL